MLEKELKTTPQSEIDVAIIGAGIVGLAIAYQFAIHGREVVVFEKERQVGLHASSRNSEVVHSGIYYPTDSLKARFSVQGKKRIYEYCIQRTSYFADEANKKGV